MNPYYLLFFLILPLGCYMKYMKYINTACKTIGVMCCCSPTSRCVTKINKDIYEISFKINNKYFKFRMKLQNGPTSIEKIVCDGKDNTKEIEPYFNFCNSELLQTITPSMLGYQKIGIEYFDGDEKCLEDNDNVLEKCLA